MVSLVTIARTLGGLGLGLEGGSERTGTHWMSYCHHSRGDIVAQAQDPSMSLNQINVTKYLQSLKYNAILKI